VFDIDPRSRTCAHNRIIIYTIAYSCVTANP